MLDLLSNQTRTTDSVSTLSTLSENIIHGVTVAFQKASVSLASVSTQTSSTVVPGTSCLQQERRTNDQAVPAVESNVICRIGQDFYGDCKATRKADEVPSNCSSVESNATEKEPVTYYVHGMY